MRVHFSDPRAITTTTHSSKFESLEKVIKDDSMKVLTSHSCVNPWSTLFGIDKDCLILALSLKTEDAET
jgi:hypothetical protein